MKSLWNTILDGLTYQDLAGRRQLRAYAVITLAILILLGLSSSLIFFRQMQFKNLAEATPVPVNTIVPITAEPTGTQPAIAEPYEPGCPTDPAKWSFADPVILQNYKIIQPGCVYLGLEKRLPGRLASTRYSTMGRIGAMYWVEATHLFSSDSFLTSLDLIPAFRRWRTGAAREYAHAQEEEVYGSSEVDTDRMFGTMARQAERYRGIIRNIVSAPSLTESDVQAATYSLADLGQEITGRPPGATSGREGDLARYARYAAVQRSGIGIVETGASIGMGIVLAPLSPLLMGAYFFTTWASGAVERIGQARGYESLGTSRSETGLLAAQPGPEP